MNSSGFFLEKKPPCMITAMARKPLKAAIAQYNGAARQAAFLLRTFAEKIHSHADESILSP